MSNLQRFPTLVKTSAEPAASAAPSDLILVDLWSALRRRRRLVFYTLGAFMALAVLACLFMKPRYEASETIQVEKEGSGPLGLDVQSGQGTAPLDSLDYNTTLQTHADVLASDALALRTIEALNLEKTYNYRPTFNPIGWVLGLIGPKGTPDPKGVPLADAPQRRGRAVQIFEKHLKVKPQDGTRLITVSYTDPDPKLASAVVSRLIEDFKEYNFEIRYAATSQAAGWLSNELSGVKKAAEDSQARVAKLQQDAQVFTAGDNDPTGKSIATSVVLTRLQDLNTALATAESNRIVKQAVYLSVKNSGAESVTGLAGNVNGASPEVTNSLGMLQGLRTQQDTLKATYAQDEVKFGPNYPQMQQMRSQIADLQRSIDEEIAKLEVRAKNDYDAAVQTEASTRDLYNKAKTEAGTLNSKAIDYTVAKQEAAQNQGIYDTLFGRVKESGALAGLRSSSISIVDPSFVPGRPKLPNVPLFLGAAFVGGLVFGCGLALLIDRFDQRVQSIDQIERELGIAPLVILPSMNAGAKGALSEPKRPPLLALAGSQKMPLARSRVLPPEPVYANGGGRVLPDLAYTEALRVLRTAILHSVDVVPPQVVLVTGSQPGDGSTSLSLNLAVLLAEQGHKTLLVECNMRRPTLQQDLGLSASGGLSSLLSAAGTAADAAVPIPDAPGAFIVTGGGTPPNPSELLGSEAMRGIISQWRERYDFIVLDTPPVLAVADSLTLLNAADLVLLLARYEHSAVKAVLQAYRVLSSAARHKLFGVVVNDVSPDSGALSDYYGFHQDLYTSELQEVGK